MGNADESLNQKPEDVLNEEATKNLESKENGISVTTNNQDKPEHNIEENEKLYLGYFKTEIIWSAVLYVGIVHMLGVYGLYQCIFNVKLPTLLLLAAYVYFPHMGSMAGAHRLFSHKAYKVTTVGKILILYFQLLSGQYTAYTWARDHRLHHKFSDTDADPYNSKRGFFFSHIGWIMLIKTKELKIKGRTIDVSDLKCDQLVMFQKKYYLPLYIVLSILMPSLIPYYWFGEDFLTSASVLFGLRTMMLWHMSFVINSVAHLYGSKPYNKGIGPVESAFVSFCSMGEGWHNYHHSFPWDYKASELGANWDGTTKFIEFLSRIGMAYDLKEASFNVVKKTAMKYGDGTWNLGKEYSEEEYNNVISNKSL